MMIQLCKKSEQDDDIETVDVVGDEEFLPMEKSSLDLVISWLGLHWTNDLPGAMIQCRLALKPDGLFLAAILGGETLKLSPQLLLLDVHSYYLLYDVCNTDASVIRFARELKWSKDASVHEYRLYRRQAFGGG